ncbi:MAG: nucleoside deaminase [Candidatus ainarchaeum sp.]|nr:nucleoside deaminase [Candidatus ainarchaeum sp.]
MDYMQKAIKEAFRGMKVNHGGPFGAVIVRKGPSKAKLCGCRKTKGFATKVIASAHNTVLKTNDPTAHAEINAIRKATKKLKRFDLSDCEIYSSCEPCPMCLAAIEWARIKKLYYGCTREDADRIGFSDKIIYGEIKKFPKTKHLVVERVCNDEIKAPFLKWVNKKDKKMY